MKIDGINLINDSKATDLVVEYGTTLLTGLNAQDEGRIFVLTAQDASNSPGLYFYDGTAWNSVNDNDSVDALSLAGKVLTVTNNRWDVIPYTDTSGRTVIGSQLSFQGADVSSDQYDRAIRIVGTSNPSIDILSDSAAVTHTFTNSNEIITRLYATTGGNNVAFPPFVSNTDWSSGLYFPADGSVGLSASGVSVLTASSSSVQVNTNDLRFHGTAPILTIKDTDGSGSAQRGYISFLNSSSSETAQLGVVNPLSNNRIFVVSNTGPVSISSYTAELSLSSTTGLSLNENVFALPSGSALIPSLTFNSDTDSGVYSSGPNELSFATGGSRRLLIADSGVYTVSGTAALPSYSFTADGDTGSYLYGTNGYGVSTGGVVRFTVENGYTTVMNYMRVLHTNPIIVIQDSDSTGAGVTGGFVIRDSGSSDVAQVGYSSGSNTDFLISNTLGDIRLLSSAGEVARITPTAISANNGSAAAPIFSFISDPDTGMYLSGTNTLSFATGGATRATINANGLYSLSGTAASPSFSFLSDGDTGVYTPSSNILGFTTGGVERARVTNNGLFTVAGTAALPSLSFTGDQDTGVFNPSSNIIAIATGGVERFLINNNELKHSGYIISTSTLQGATIVGSAAAWSAIPTGAKLFINPASTGGPTAAFTYFSKLGHRDISGGWGGFAGGYSGGGAYYGSAATSGDLPTWEKLFTSGSVSQGINGTPALPAYSFLNDPDTGIYSSGTNDVSVSVGGVRRLAINTTGIYNASGTSALPAYSFLSDTDSGMYSYGANILGFSTAGVVRMTISSSVVSSGLPFQAPAGSVGAPAFSFSGDTNSGMYSVSSDVIGFSANGIVRVTIGNTFNAAVPMQVNTGTVASPAYSFNGDTGTGIFSSGLGLFQIATSGVSRFAISNSGADVYAPRLRIYNTNPYITLHDTDSSGNTQIGYINFRDTANTQTAYVGHVSTSNTNFSMKNFIGDVEIEASSSVTFKGAAYIFDAVPTTASAANVYIDSVTGYILRSTSSIRYKKDIEPVTSEMVNKFMGSEPMTYYSSIEGDDPDKRHLGFTAERLDKLGLTELVVYKDYGDGPIPESVQYERVTVLLTAKIQDQETRIRFLENKLLELLEKIV